MTQITELRALRRLKKKAVLLNDLVEGVGFHEWRDDRGLRLKDTKAWVNFYNALWDCEKEAK